MKLKGIEKALNKGCKIHAFRSGGGLRVVRIEKDDVLKGYGEHPEIEEAIAHANEDYLKGGRPYKKVYGKSKTHYLTGSGRASSALDEWILRGNTFDVWKDGENIVFQLKGLTVVHIPEEIKERVQNSGKSEKWEHRGFTYVVSPHKFDTGLPGIGCEVIHPTDKKEKAKSLIYDITKTGSSNNFYDAMSNALQAEEVEV